MPYVDGMITAATDRDAYRSYAEKVSPILRQYGATRVVDSWGTDVPPGKQTDFYRAVATTEGETVVFSWIEWPDKATRDQAWGKIMADNAMPAGDAPFDMKRMIFGGFEVIVDL